jgi:uncharacterized membrane protein
MSVTELDDLKIAWQTLNRNLERQHTLALHQFRESKMARFRSGFWPLVAGQIAQLIIGLLLALWGGSFWFDHPGVTHLMIYGISIHAYAIMLIVFSARDLYLIKRMDYAAAVLVLQKQLDALRRWHLRAALWFGSIGCFIWIPILLLFLYRRGVDVWLHRPAVVGWFFLSGLVSLGIFLAIIFWSRRSGRENLAKKLEDESAGFSVKRAQAVLDEVARFEQE